MNVYKSREIRWFFQENSEIIARWFGIHGLEFQKVSRRTDQYLIPTLKNDLGIKLREGRLEIKQRLAGPEEGSLYPNCSGFYEQWTKWGFMLPESNSFEPDTLGKSEHDQWLEVSKMRLAINIGQDNQGKVQIYDLGKPLSVGCQVEYTHLQITEENWYSFGLEWFGNQWLELPNEILSDLLEDIVLPVSNSSGYPGFLLKRLGSR